MKCPNCGRKVQGFVDWETCTVHCSKCGKVVDVVDSRNGKIQPCWECGAPTTNKDGICEECQAVLDLDGQR